MGGKGPHSIASSAGPTSWTLGSHRISEKRSWNPSFLCNTFIYHLDIRLHNTKGLDSYHNTALSNKSLSKLKKLCSTRVTAYDVFFTKGQLISKGLFGILNSSKKGTKKFDFTTMIPQVDLFLFIWKKLKTPKRHFEIN